MECMRDALVLVDAFADFGHEDGDALHTAFRRAHPALLSVLACARARGMPVVYCQ